MYIPAFFPPQPLLLLSLTDYHNHMEHTSSPPQNSEVSLTSLDFVCAKLVIFIHPMFVVRVVHPKYPKVISFEYWPHPFFFY